jgi:hypothetical protein
LLPDSFTEASAALRRRRGFLFGAFPAIAEPFLLWQLGDRKQQVDIGQARQRRLPRGL